MPDKGILSTKKMLSTGVAANSCDMLLQVIPVKVINNNNNKLSDQ